MNKLYITLALLFVATAAFAKQQILVQSADLTNQGQLQKMRLNIEKQLSIKMRLVKQKEKNGSYVFETDDSVSAADLELLEQQLGVKLYIMKSQLPQSNQVTNKVRSNAKSNSK